MSVSLSDSQRKEYLYLDYIYNNPNILTDEIIAIKVEEYQQLLLRSEFDKLDEKIRDIPKEIPKDFGFINTSKNGRKQRTFFGLIERPDVILFLAFMRAKSPDEELWRRVRTVIRRWMINGFQFLCYWPVIITGFGHNETVVISVNAAVIVAN